MTPLTQIKATLASHALDDSFVVKRLTKSEGVIACADTLRKATHAAGFNDETFLGILHGDVIPFVGLGDKHPEPAKSFTGLLVRKARYSNRHPENGRFVAAETHRTDADGITWTHALSGATHPTLRNGG
jgi:hypothetical protein